MVSGWNTIPRVTAVAFRSFRTGAYTEPIKRMALYSLHPVRCARMMYFKSVLVGLGTVLSGCVVTPIAMMIWWTWKSNAANKAGPGEMQVVSFSPMGLENHLAHSLGFWVF